MKMMMYPTGYHQRHRHAKNLGLLATLMCAEAVIPWEDEPVPLRVVRQENADNLPTWLGHMKRKQRRKIRMNEIWASAELSGYIDVPNIGDLMKESRHKVPQLVLRKGGAASSCLQPSTRGWGRLEKRSRSAACITREEGALVLFSELSIKLDVLERAEEKLKLQKPKNADTTMALNFIQEETTKIRKMSTRDKNLLIIAGKGPRRNPQKRPIPKIAASPQSSVGEKIKRLSYK